MEDLRITKEFPQYLDAESALLKVGAIIIQYLGDHKAF